MRDAALATSAQPLSASAPAQVAGGYPSHPDHIPGDELASGRYFMRYARTARDLEAVERLRFEVFNLELREGLDSAFATGRDHDEFDDCFHHLMIVSRDTGLPVGTYRMQTSEMARSNRGFYSAGEFDLSRLPASFIEQSVEVGRACVAREHRNGRVLHLLWRGLALYMTWNDKRFLFGCCSLTSQDPALGAATMQFLEREGRVHADLLAPPLPGLGCEEAELDDINRQRVHIPPLFQSYLTLGAKICGPPAIDRLFKTIDFLVALDVQSLDQHSFRFFFR